MATTSGIEFKGIVQPEDIKLAIKSCFEVLVHNLKADEITIPLLERNAITLKEKQHIDCEKQNKGSIHQAEKLVEYILVKEDLKCLTTFVEVIKSRQHATYILIENAIKDTRIQRIKNFFTLTRFKAGTGIKCDLCKQANSEAKCENCKENLCRNCEIAHTSSVASKSHIIITQQLIVQDIQNTIKHVEKEITALNRELKSTKLSMENLKQSHSEQIKTVHLQIDDMQRKLELHRESCIKYITKMNTSSIKKLEYKDELLTKIKEQSQSQIDFIHSLQSCADLSYISKTMDQVNSWGYETKVKEIKSAMEEMNIPTKSQITIKRNEFDPSNHIEALTLNTHIRQYTLSSSLSSTDDWSVMDAISGENANTRDYSTFTSIDDSPMDENVDTAVRSRHEMPKSIQGQTTGGVKNKFLFSRSQTNLANTGDTTNIVEAGVDKNNLKSVSSKSCHTINKLESPKLPVDARKGYQKSNQTLLTRNSPDIGTRQKTNLATNTKVPIYEKKKIEHEKWKSNNAYHRSRSTTQQNQSKFVFKSLLSSPYRMEEKIQNMDEPFYNIQMVNNQFWCCPRPDNNKIFVYDTKWNKVCEVKNFKIWSPTDVAETQNGNIIVSCINGLHELNPKGEYIREVIKGSFSSISSSNGQMCALEYKKCVVFWLKFNGNIWEKINQFQLEYNNGRIGDRICCNADHLFISTEGCNVVYMYKINGSLVKKINTEKTGARAPRLCCVDENNAVLVIDRNLKKVMLYDKTADSWKDVINLDIPDLPESVLLDKVSGNIFINTDGKKLLKYVQT